MFNITKKNKKKTTNYLILQKNMNKQHDVFSYVVYIIYTEGQNYHHMQRLISRGIKNEDS